MTKKHLLAIALLVTAIAVFAATQLDLWRTGRDDLPALALVAKGPKIEPASRIWTDTDAACGATARTDPDDCLAILWMVSREADVAGISTSFGNASGKVVQQRVATLMMHDGAGRPVCSARSQRTC